MLVTEMLEMCLHKEKSILTYTMHNKIDSVTIINKSKHKI